MRKILLFLLFFVVSVNIVNAQFPGFNAAPKVTVMGKITGVVLDSVTKAPIDYATISLVLTSTNKSVNGSVTDPRGRFTLGNVAPNTYKVMIGFMGYNTKTITVTTTPAKPDFSLNNILLSTSSNLLEDVEVVGTKAVIESKVDRMIYNAENDATNAGGDATDVMRKVPMLTVDADGNVQMRGSSVRVLINGKPSGTMANSVADALKMIPADQIKSVEVITSPSAKYDAEGAGGIINIITKKSDAQGVSGSVNAAAGTRQNSANFNLTAKTGRLTVNTALGANYAYPQSTRILMSNITYANDGSIANSTIQDGYSKWKRPGYNGNVGLDYDLNAYNNFSSSVKFNYFANGGPGESNVLINDRLLRNITDNDMNFTNFDWNVDYRKTSKKEGEEFSIAAQISQGNNNTDYTNILQSANVADILTSNSNTGKNREITTQTDYTYPFSKTTILEVGMKGVFRNILSDGLIARSFDYNQNVGSAYSVLSFNASKKIKVKAGLRAEYTHIDGIFASDLPIKNDYTNLFPSLIVSQNLKANSSVKFSYNRRIQRPSLFFLNPFRNESNQFNISEGNPTLAPELSDNLEFGYSTYIKGSVINASVFYRRTADVIENAVQTIIEGGIEKTLTRPINVGASESYGANLFASYNIKPKWTLMANAGLNTYKVSNQSASINTGTFVNYTLFARSAYSFGDGWSTEIYGVLTGARRTFQGKSDALAFYGAAIKRDILNKKGTIGINTFSPFNKYLNIKTLNTVGNTVQNMDISYPIRSFGINFSYKFGKLKYTEKRKIKNDDLKKGDEQGGMGAIQQ